VVAFPYIRSVSWLAGLGLVFRRTVRLRSRGTPGRVPATRLLIRIGIRADRDPGKTFPGYTVPGPISYVHTELLRQTLGTDLDFLGECRADSYCGTRGVGDQWGGESLSVSL
jgi:hypothetical protein